MTPVHQLVSDAGKGDCWRCCIASILGISAEDVPNFVGDADHSRGIIADDLCYDWLNARGFGIVRFNRWKDTPPEDPIDWTLVCGLYAIASVPSQRFPGGRHAVVVQFQKEDKRSTRLRVVHDPQPLNAPYPDDTEFRRLEFIVPFLPRIPMSSAPSDEALIN